jgi:hypothetical protein
MSWNVFTGDSRAKSNPDSLPTPLDSTGPCSWCGRVSNFKVEDSDKWLKSEPTGYRGGFEASLTYGILRCDGCGNALLVVSDQAGDGVHWFPPPGSGTLDKQVNAQVASAYDEGMRCLSIRANRAAAVMFRSALSLFVKDKGGENAKGERHLKSALKHMKNEGDLHKSLWEWADHLNQLGNEGAHPEDYDNVTAEEADGLGRFVRHLIRHEYEMPAQLLRAQGLLKDDEPDEVDAGPGASAGEPALYGGLDGRLVNPGDRD